MTVTTTTFTPGTSLTGSLAPVAQPSSFGQVTQGLVVNPGSTAGTLAVSVSKGGGAAQPLIVARPIAGPGTVALPEFSNFAVSAGDTILASGAGLGLWLGGFVVTA